MTRSHLIIYPGGGDDGGVLILLVFDSDGEVVEVELGWISDNFDLGNTKSAAWSNTTSKKKQC